MKIIDRRKQALGGQRNDRKVSDVKRIFWHYTAVRRQNRAFITGHENYWKNTLGWDRGGYHYYIDADGNIYQNYNHSRITWGVSNHNWDAVHISVEANSVSNYSPAQIKARDWLTRRLMKQLNVPASRVYGHNEYQQTACPGYSKQQMNAFRAQLAKGGSPSISTNIGDGWVINEYGTQYKQVKGKWISKSDSIRTRFGGPFRSLKYGGTAKKGYIVDYTGICRQDGHIWLEYTLDKGKTYKYIPVKTWNRTTGGVGPDWGDWL